MMTYVILVNTNPRTAGMRLTKEKVAENKARVIATAARLFREKGFEGVGVADLMHAAGLTHGGFYNHFESKDALTAETCAWIFENTVAMMEGMAGIEDDAERADAIADYKRRYLSRKGARYARRRAARWWHSAPTSRASPVRCVRSMPPGCGAISTLSHAHWARAARHGARPSGRRPSPRSRCSPVPCRSPAASPTADPELSDEILAAAAARLPETKD